MDLELTLVPKIWMHMLMPESEHRQQQPWDLFEGSLKEHIMCLDFSRLRSICHFSYYMRSVTQFILFIYEIFALPFDKFLWHLPTSKRKIAVGDENYKRKMGWDTSKWTRTKQTDTEDIRTRYSERSVWVLIILLSLIGILATLPTTGVA